MSAQEAICSMYDLHRFAEVVVSLSLAFFSFLLAGYR